MPRPSALKHPLAILRKKLDLVQKEFADIAGVSAATIQSIELGRLELSERLAAKISDQTGVSMAWLLDGDLESPIPASTSRGYCFVEYSKEHFELAQAKQLPEVSEEALIEVLRVLQPRLVGAYRSAKERGAEDAQRCYHRITDGLKKLGDELQRDFGDDLDYEKAIYRQMSREITQGVDIENRPAWKPIPDSELPTDEEFEMMIQNSKDD